MESVNNQAPEIEQSPNASPAASPDQAAQPGAVALSQTQEPKSPLEKIKALLPPEVRTEVLQLITKLMEEVRKEGAPPTMAEAKHPILPSRREFQTMAKDKDKERKPDSPATAGGDSATPSSRPTEPRDAQGRAGGFGRRPERKITARGFGATR